MALFEDEDTLACSTTLAGCVWTMVHGYDYVSSGTKASLVWLEDMLSNAYEIKT